MKKNFLFIALAVLAASCASQKYSRTDNITDDVYFSPSEIDYSVKISPGDSLSESDGFTYDNSPSTANPNAGSSYHQYQQQNTNNSNTSTNTQISTPSSAQNAVGGAVFQNVIIMPNFGRPSYNPYFSTINPWYGSYGQWGYPWHHRNRLNLIWVPHYGWTVNYNISYGNPYFNPYYSSPFYNPYFSYNNSFYNPYCYSYGNGYYNPYGYNYYGYNNNYYGNPSNPFNSGFNQKTTTYSPRRSGGSYVPSNLGTYSSGRRRTPSQVTPSKNSPGQQGQNGQDIGAPSSSPSRGGSGITPSQGSTDNRRRPSSGSNSTNDDNQPSARPQSPPSSPSPNVNPTPRTRQPDRRPSAPSTPNVRPSTRPSSGSSGGGRSRGGSSGGGSTPRRR